MLCCVSLVLLPMSHHIDLPKANVNRSPDWFMIKAKATKIDETGQIAGSIQSPLLRHYTLDNRVAITAPFFILYDKDRLPWHITAEKSDIFRGRDERVEFYGHVLVKQMPGKNSNEITLMTEHLTYYPKTSQALTKEPVTITEPGATVHSIGFQADFKQSIIKFLSQTQTQYYEQNHSEKH